MARRGGELEALVAVGAGGVVALLCGLALHGLALADRLPAVLHGRVALLAAVIGIGCAVPVYRALRAQETAQLVQDLDTLKGLKDRQDSKSRAASSS